MAVINENEVFFGIISETNQVTTPADYSVLELDGTNIYDSGIVVLEEDTMI